MRKETKSKEYEYWWCEQEKRAKKTTTEKARWGEYEDEENDEDDHSKEHAHGAKPGIGALELAAADRGGG